MTRNRNDEKKYLYFNNIKVPETVKTYLQDIDFPIEFLDIVNVLEMGSKKHGKDSWRDKNNISLQHKNNHASMSRHLSEFYCQKLKDDESGLDPLLHLAARALMAYTRRRDEI